MKEKVLYLLIIVLLTISLFLLTACGKTEEIQDNKNSSLDSSNNNDNGLISNNTSDNDFVESELNNVEIDTFNSQFTTYEGEQPGSNIKVLLNKIIMNIVYKKIK